MTNFMMGREFFFVCLFVCLSYSKQLLETFSFLSVRQVPHLTNTSFNASQTSAAFRMLRQLVESD